MTRTAWKLAGTASLFLLLTAADAPPRAIDLPGDRLFPESVSVTPDGTAYIGSLSGGVLRVSLTTGKAGQWISPGAFGSGSTFGVLADPRNNMLWLCNNDISGAGVAIAGADKGSVLKGFDLKSGKGRISLPLDGARPFCNDMAVGRDGSVYITDTGAPRILVWHPGATALAVWLSDPALDSPRGGGLDGIAFGADGHLYVNNFYTNGLLRIAMGARGKPGRITPITLSRPLEMPDGMRPLGGTRFALAEGKGKISVLTVTGEHARVETIRDGLSSATGVGHYRGVVWYVQGELSYVFQPAKRALTAPLPFRITPVTLTP